MNNDFQSVENGTKFEFGEVVLTNIYLNDTENVKITIKKEKEEKKEDEGEKEKEEEKEKEDDKSQNGTTKTNNFFRVRKNRGLSKAGVVLISVLVPIGLIGIVVALITLIRKTDPLANIKVNNNQIDSIKNVKY